MSITITESASTTTTSLWVFLPVKPPQGKPDEISTSKCQLALSIVKLCRTLASRHFIAADQALPIRLGAFTLETKDPTEEGDQHRDTPVLRYQVVHRCALDAGFSISSKK